MKWALIILLGVASPAPAPAEPDPEAARVLLRGQEAHLLADATPPTLAVLAEAENTLSVRVEAVRVGVLFAETKEALRGADPSKLYREGPPPGGRVGVVQERVPMPAPAGARVPLTFRVAVPANAPKPVIFLTHVLGYDLAEADAATLLSLLGTAAAADEVAACATFALTGAAAAKAAARARWRDDRQLVVDLAAALVAPVPRNPSQAETFRRVFAIRALGVLGGPTARDTLEKLLRPEQDPSAFDSPLQVLRVARLVGSPLETPLAFAVPPETRRLRDVVAAALDDLQTLDHLPAPPPAATTLASPGVEPAPVLVPEPNPGGAPWWRYAVGAVLGLGLAVLWQRIRRQRARAP